MKYYHTIFVLETGIVWHAANKCSWKQKHITRFVLGKDNRIGLVCFSEDTSGTKYILYQKQ